MIGMQMILNIAAEELYHFLWKEITDSIILEVWELGILLAD